MKSDKKPRIKNAKNMTSLLISTMLSLAAVTHAAPVQWSSAAGGNDHWYEFVPGTTSITWGGAAADAASRSHGGQGGYLATVTSAGERDFVVGQFTGQTVNPWIGGSDAAEEGVWRWVTGPEAGNSVVFTDWYPGEPNNYRGEHHLQMLFVFSGTDYGGRWNDLDAGNLWGMANGYLVEYGGAPVGVVPEPASAALLAAGLFGLMLLRKRRPSRSSR